MQVFLMRFFALFMLLFALTGCVSDVSDIPPHNKLAGTVWKLKTDAYVIEFADNRRTYLIIPNTDKFGAYLNYKIIGEPYSEDNIGKKLEGVKIVGGLRAGEHLKVIRVEKHPHIEMGTWYIPVMIPEQSNQWTGDKELSGHKLYRNFYDKGILNPECAEIVSSATNPPPRGAEGGGGSESSNP